MTEAERQIKIDYIVSSLIELGLVKIIDEPVQPSESDD